MYVKRSETAKLLDELQAALRLPSDYALAPVLGVTRSQVSRYRCGHDSFNEPMALKVADLLGKEPQYVLTRIAADRAHSERARRAWLKVAASAAALVLCVLAGADRAPLILAAHVHDFGINPYYVKCLVLLIVTLCLCAGRAPAQPERAR